MGSKWWRVIDPLNPMFGCDVRGTSAGGWLLIDAMRRVDVFVGDRPYQLVARDGQSLGLKILNDEDTLTESHVQDEIVELKTDRPFGRCIDESDMTRKDGHTLRVAQYENAVQIALDDPEGTLLGTRTFSGLPDETDGVLRQVTGIFDGGDPDDIVAILQGSN
jgi:hypothetical protein